MIFGNKKFIIFLPNGNGDMLMLIPALKRLISNYGIDNIIVIVASKTQLNFLKFYLGSRLSIIQRYDGRIFPNLRLFIKIALIRDAVIYAPLLSKKRLHFLFFLFLGKRVYVPRSFISKPRYNLIPFKHSLESFPGHQVNYLVQFIAQTLPLDMTGEVKESEIILCKSEIAHDDLISSSRPHKVALGISCGILERHKIPSPIFFANLVNLISEKVNIEWLIFSVSSDKLLIDEFFQHLNSGLQIHNIIDLDFIKAIELMSTCDLGISGTTGQGHMMAAAGIPILVLAGVTEPLESGPYGRRVSVLKHSLPCGPCYQERFRFGCSRFRCMETLNLGDGVAQALNLLEDPSYGLGWRAHIQKTEPIPVPLILKILNSKNCIS